MMLTDLDFGGKGQMAERSKALRSGRSQLSLAWVRKRDRMSHSDQMSSFVGCLRGTPQGTPRCGGTCSIIGASPQIAPTVLTAKSDTVWPIERL